MALAPTKPPTRTTRSLSALEKAKSDATQAVALSRNTIDMSDPAIVEAYVKIRDDDDETSFMVLGYRGSKAKLELYASGPGGFDEIVAAIPEEPCYAYFKVVYGDSGRNKFVFLTFVPDSLSGIKKSQIMNHKAPVDRFFKFYQLTWPIMDKSELKWATLEQMLLKAGGANYSVQEDNKGDFGSYKQNTKEFYAETEKQGNLAKVVYDAGPLSETPLDISGRSMVASQTDFKKNVIDLDTKK